MFPWDGPLPAPRVRTIEEIRGVLMDPACECREPLYFMFRALSKTPEDGRWLEENSLRYDVTVIPARTLCGECVKTKGHHHPPNGKGVPYPEIYEVIQGRADYLLQTRSADDVRLVRAGPGDRVIIPPGFGHVTVNPGGETLVMANMVSTRFESDYSVYERLGGAAYFELAGGSLVKNARYTIAAGIRTMDASRQGGLRLLPARSLYDLIGSESLAFLNRPEDYPELFS
ncbi:MAG TPA: glucose-6-phosphate isomerase family protein [Methanomicrobiales archaeon]|jgi:glucose-6-phosphate isomerase|nr:glucose-6-phosphate isomerase family protein [Methanomicrobiales archaeon]